MNEKTALLVAAGAGLLLLLSKRASATTAPGSVSCGPGGCDISDFEGTTIGAILNRYRTKVLQAASAQGKRVADPFTDTSGFGYSPAPVSEAVLNQQNIPGGSEQWNRIINALFNVDAVYAELGLPFSGDPVLALDGLSGAALDRVVQLHAELAKTPSRWFEIGYGGWDEDW